MQNLKKEELRKKLYEFGKRQQVSPSSMISILEMTEEFIDLALSEQKKEIKDKIKEILQKAKYSIASKEPLSWVEGATEMYSDIINNI